MKYFKVWPEYDKGGSNYARWVDDGLFLINFWLWQERPLLDEWPKGLEFSISKGGQLCDVLFNPLALFNSPRVRDALEPTFGGTVEWLPAAIQGRGVYYIMHPLRAVNLSPEAKLATGGNYIEKYAFADPSTLPPCFLIRDPKRSPESTEKTCMSDVIVNEQVRLKFLSFRGVDFAKVFDV